MSATPLRARMIAASDADIRAEMAGMPRFDVVSAAAAILHSNEPPWPLEPWADPEAAGQHPTIARRI
jgi:hypothetical protein